MVCKASAADLLALYIRLLTPEPDYRIAVWHSELYLYTDRGCICRWRSPLNTPVTQRESSLLLYDRDA